MDPSQRLLVLLARTPALDAPALRAASAQLGGLSALGTASAEAMRAAGLVPRSIEALLWPDEALLEADAAAQRQHALALLPATDPRYPPRLAECRGAPPVLWVRGDLSALAQPQLAMVGSRHPTALGAATARQFAAWFARAGLGITSGLARGIDAASHEGALAAGGQTIAVCGGGLDSVYPAEHAGLAARIAASGALISEFPPGTPARRENFPQRNRIIAALSHGTLVVEAALRSGSLITARQAGELGRDVFAIPGSIHSLLSRGCHRLIREGAQLVEDAAEVLAALKLPLVNQILVEAPALSGQGPGAARPLDKPAEILLDALGFGPTGIDDLVARTGLPSESVASTLLILELEGVISAEPGGRYSRRNMTNTP